MLEPPSMTTRPAFDQDVQDVALLISGTPQLMNASIDLEEHFIKMPNVTGPMTMIRRDGAHAFSMPHQLLGRLWSINLTIRVERLVEFSSVAFQSLLKSEPGPSQVAQATNLF
jgi:hypothetical protein